MFVALVICVRVRASSDDLGPAFSLVALVTLSLGSAWR